MNRWLFITLLDTRQSLGHSMHLRHRKDSASPLRPTEIYRSQDQNICEVLVYWFARVPVVITDFTSANHFDDDGSCKPER